MMELIYFILVSYGITAILVGGFIFNKIRPKWHFFSCSQCMGFWVGILLGILSPYTSLWSFDITVCDIILLGGLSSGTSYILYQIINDSGIRFIRED